MVQKCTQKARVQRMPLASGEKKMQESTHKTDICAGRKINAFPMHNTGLKSGTKGLRNMKKLQE